MSNLRKLVVCIIVLSIVSIAFLLLFCVIARSTDISNFHPVAYVVLFGANMGALTCSFAAVNGYWD
jgi:hypothetical protein